MLGMGLFPIRLRKERVLIAEFRTNVKLTIPIFDMTELHFGDQLPDLFFPRGGISFSQASAVIGLAVHKLCSTGKYAP